MKIEILQELEKGYQDFLETVNTSPSDKARLAHFLFTRLAIDDVPAEDEYEEREKEETIALVEHEIKRLMHIVIQQY